MVTISHATTGSWNSRLWMDWAPKPRASRGRRTPVRKTARGGILNFVNRSLLFAIGSGAESRKTLGINQPAVQLDTLHARQPGTRRQGCRRGDRKALPATPVSGVTKPPLSLTPSTSVRGNQSTPVSIRVLCVHVQRWQRTCNAAIERPNYSMSRQRYCNAAAEDLSGRPTCLSDLTGLWTEILLPSILLISTGPPLQSSIIRRLSGLR